MRTEHKSAVSFSLGKQDLSFENEVTEFFIGHNKKLLIPREVDFSIHDLDLAPLVGVVPAVHRLTIKKRGKAIGIGFFLCHCNRGTKANEEW